MTEEWARQAVAYHWKLPFDNWRIGVMRLMMVFG